ncbi:hypothetical protein BMW23_0029 [Bodo saltans virus]|uniref:Uncharacterized protein n=1 Tax=Bodo saltans virus TaxID=2024608 RepID=A0A2H4UT10_9VIRU|nr:hypothetical protein QJ851_gp0028 [Bodo saltans virus]ATZ80091.1 hypothetical protein BMW23_0029 [Bodo saltans virus]
MRYSAIGHIAISNERSAEFHFMKFGERHYLLSYDSTPYTV